MAARECCMGWQRRRMVEIEDENGGCDDGGEGQHSLVFYFVGGLGHKNVVGLNELRKIEKEKERYMKLSLFDLDFDKV